MASVTSVALMACRISPNCIPAPVTVAWCCTPSLAGAERYRLRAEPLEKRKSKLQKLLEPADPIRLQSIEHTDHDGAKIFRHVCKLGFEGIVSKRRDFGYRSGRAKSWIKVKNPNSPAMLRIEEGTF